MAFRSSMHRAEETAAQQKIKAGERDRGSGRIVVVSSAELQLPSLFDDATGKKLLQSPACIGLPTTPSSPQGWRRRAIGRAQDRLEVPADKLEVTSPSSSREGAQTEKNWTGRKSILSRSASLNSALRRAWASAARRLFRPPDGWSAETGAADGPRCACRHAANQCHRLKPGFWRAVFLRHFPVLCRVIIRWRIRGPERHTDLRKSCSDPHSAVWSVADR